MDTESEIHTALDTHTCRINKSNLEFQPCHTIMH